MRHEPLRRNRQMGPTQQHVLATVAQHPGKGRVALAEAAGLTPEQTISALRGLLRRQRVRRVRAGQGRTAPFTYYPAEVE